MSMFTLNTLSTFKCFLSVVFLPLLVVICLSVFMSVVVSVFAAFKSEPSSSVNEFNPINYGTL